MGQETHQRVKLNNQKQHANLLYHRTDYEVVVYIEMATTTLVAAKVVVVVVVFR